MNGNWVKPLQETKRKATVLIFVANDCPISNSYAPQLNRVIKQFSARNVVFYLVYTDPELSPTAARTHLRQFGYRCSAVFDREHRLTKLVGATVTPEVAVLAPDGTRRYRGRIDDRYVAYGKRRVNVQSHDLRDALQAIVNGKAVKTPVTTAVGCFISRG
ncbi:MAG TPA: redoxin domain-containing protein [Abditibacteriaceae bacterium]|nr:redoxin domain-containing protein [Abditibacteriaceae bacterium]